MNDPISFAIQSIRNEIPHQILERFFTPSKFDRLRRDPFLQGNIDGVILDKVINRRVRMDIDTAGCTEITIDLEGVPVQQIDHDKYLYHIPKERTNGRVITSAISLMYNKVLSGSLGNSMMSTVGISPQVSNYPISNMPGGGMYGYGNNGCPGKQGALGLASSIANQNQMPRVESTNLRVIDGHTILVEELMFPQSRPSLRCIVSSDSTFSTLSRPAWRHFADLCVLATKAYIYTQHIIDIDEGELHAGQQLGRFKEMIESWSDANEQYSEFYYTRWRKIQFMADTPRYTRYLKGLMGRGF